MIKGIHTNISLLYFLENLGGVRCLLGNEWGEGDSDCRPDKRLGTMYIVGIPVVKLGGTQESDIQVVARMEIRRLTSQSTSQLSGLELI